MGTIYIDSQFKRFPKINAISKDQIGQPNGVAGLDENGKILESQLPGYVDDVIEVESYDSLPTIGESGKIYVTADTNLTYRWSGSQYMNISSTLALGETAETAYPGDKGKQNRIDIDDLKTQKADKTEVYTKQESDSKYLSEIPSQYVTEDQLDLKVNKTEVYTKEEVQQQILDLKYVHPDVSHIPEGGNPGQVLVNNGDGDAKWDYLSELVTISVFLSDSDVVEGVVVTLQIGSNITTYNYSESIQVNVPLGLQYEVSVSNKTGYSTPNSVTLTASKNSRNIVLKYYKESEQSLIFDDTNEDSHPGLQVETDNDTSWIRGRRCLVRNTGSGVAICYLDENNSHLFHDGSTIAKLDGSMGDWMTDIPEYWYKVEEVENGKNILKISSTYIDGYKHSPRTLLGVAKAYYDSNKEVLVSIENVKPIMTIPQYGVVKKFGILDLYKYCHNKGTGWMMIDYETHKKISHLFCAKYKTRNPWEIDIFNASLIKKIAYNTGLSVNLGNNDGKYTTIDGDVVSFLGIEDVYGNTLEYLEGIHGYRSPDGVVVYIYDGLKPTVSDSSQLQNCRELLLTSFTGQKEYLGEIKNLYWGEYADVIPTSLVKWKESVDALSGNQTNYPDLGLIGSGYGDKFHIAVRSWTGNDIKHCGIYTIHIAKPSWSSLNNSSTRIQYRGEIKVIDNPEDFLAPTLSEGTSLDSSTLYYITPEEFGAKGDGITDDTEALNKCFKASEEKGLNVKALQSYKTSSSVTVSGNYKSYEINYIDCSSTTEPAIIFIGKGNNLSVQRITAQFEAIQMSDISGMSTICNTIRIGTIAVNGDAVTWKNSGSVYQNTFYFNNITCNSVGSCFEQEKYEHGYISENNYYGGYVGYCNYFFHGTGSNNKFYNIQLEEKIKICWWFTEAYYAQIFAERHAEIVQEDEATLLKLGTGDDLMISNSANAQGLIFYTTPQIRINTIDISGAYIRVLVSNNVGETYLTSSAMNYCSAMISTSKQATASTSHILAHGFWMWGRRFIWKYRSKIDSNLVEQVTDFRDSNSLKKPLPYKMYITIPDSELYLHSAYCLFGQDTFEIVQDEVNKVKIYDSDGNLIWNGWEQPAGNYQFTHIWNNDLSTAGRYQAVKYNYEDCYWKVTKLDEIDDKLKWKIIE